MADEEEQDVGPKTRTGAEQAAALDRVTDRVRSCVPCLLCHFHYTLFT